MQVARPVGLERRAGVERTVTVDEQHVAAPEPKADLVGAVADEPAKHPVGAIPLGQVGVVEGQRLHQLVRESQVAEASVNIASNHGVTAESIGVTGVLAEPHLDAAEYVDGGRVEGLKLFQYTPAVDDDRVSPRRLVDQHRQDLAARRVAVLGVVVVRRQSLGRERHVVAGGVDLDVEDETERGIDERQADRPSEVDDGARYPRRIGDDDGPVAAERLEHLPAGVGIGEHRIMLESAELIVAGPERGGVLPPRRRRANVGPRVGCVHRSVTVCPGQMQLPVDDSNVGDGRRIGLHPGLASPLVGLDDSTVRARAVVAQPFVGKLHDPRFEGDEHPLTRGRGVDEGSVGERSAASAHINMAEDSVHVHIVAQRVDRGRSQLRKSGSGLQIEDGLGEPVEFVVPCRHRPHGSQHELRQPLLDQLTEQSA